jgi:hypothetical protein
MTLLVEPRPASVLQAWPRVAICSCGDEVLLARHLRAGRPLRLEPIPVLPEGRCDACRGTGRRSLLLEIDVRPTRPRHGLDEPGALAGVRRYRTVNCPACGGTGRRGVRLDADLVLVSAYDGIARPFDGQRTGWEAAHRRHRCALAA